MSRKLRRTAPADAPTTAPNLDIQSVRVNREGYDASGAYWGAGPDVFIATTADGAQEITVRAKCVAEAREKVAVELARPLGQPTVGPREPIGGTSPNKTRYEIDWRDPVAGTEVRVRITHSRDYLGQGQDHIEVESIAPKKAPLPITQTGYRSLFMSPLDLINDGGPVTFVTAWLDREAKGKDWQRRQAVRQQGDLFQWAETQAEVGARRNTGPKHKRATTPNRPSDNSAGQANPIIAEAAARMAEFDPAAAKAFIEQPANRTLIAEAFEHGFRKHSKVSALVCTFIKTVLKRASLDGAPAPNRPSKVAKSTSKPHNKRTPE